MQTTAKPTRHMFFMHGIDTCQLACNFPIPIKQCIISMKSTMDSLIYFLYAVLLPPRSQHDYHSSYTNMPKIKEYQFAYHSNHATMPTNRVSIPYIMPTKTTPMPYTIVPLLMSLSKKQHHHQNQTCFIHFQKIWQHLLCFMDKKLP